MTNSVREQHFITAIELASLVGDGTPLAILDVGVGSKTASAREQFEQGHIPAAVFVELEKDLQAPAAGAVGKRPLPSLDVLEDSARTWGIGADTTVVVYDRLAGTKAGRAWWVLRWAGAADVRILDGGLDAWTRAGQPITDVVVTPERGDITLSPDHLPYVTTEEAVELAKNGRLFDARTEQQFVGGHIPHARWVSTRDNLTEDGLLREPEWIRERYAALGVDGDNETAFYCGGAVAAAHGVAVLASIGVPVSLYLTSFGGWSADPEREIAVGEDPTVGR